MNKKFDLNQESLDKVSGGGARFEASCSCCGKTIYYGDHRWGEEKRDDATFCKGYFCNECVKQFQNNEINDDDMLQKFRELDNRGDVNRYAPL